MEARNLAKWVEKLKMSSDSRERRVALQKLEPLLEGLAQAETDILFPVLRKFVGFGEWMQEAHAHHMSFRELIQFAHLTMDHEKILDITDELAARIAQYLDGMQKILYPRLNQALNREELEELRVRLDRYWVFPVSSDVQTAA
jgi:hypothetical protein